LYYYGARYYDPSLGRFVSADPGIMLGINLSLSEMLNLYAYCLNNPLESTDPTGLAEEKEQGEATTEQIAAQEAAVVASLDTDGDGNYDCDDGGDDGYGRKEAARTQIIEGVTRAEPARIAAGILAGANIASDSVLRNIYGNGISGLVDDLSLIDRDRLIHILLGDETGGGHLWPGEGGKTPFPKDWTPQRIVDAISDVATNPNSILTPSGRSVLQAVGAIDGVSIKVILRLGRIITGYPINLPRNE
jgi:RHS repeat-associated protein